MIRLVEDAQLHRSRMEQLVEKCAKIYTPSKYLFKCSQNSLSSLIQWIDSLNKQSCNLKFENFLVEPHWTFHFN